jgi:1-acyl-sn-glycerol-3-phosphate acyltransferase
MSAGLIQVATAQAPHPVQFKGNRIAQWLLRRLGWRFEFEGLPARQGVFVVYPHTSNWDFPIGLLLKWAMGIEVNFWGKDSLFRFPIFSHWLRWVGGVPLARSKSRGVVEQMVAQMRAKKDRAEYFWLALSPEGTRSFQPGWRSGFYRLAHEAQVPLGLVSFDYGRRVFSCRRFMTLSGDRSADMQVIASAFDGVSGYRPALAAPVRLGSDGDKK